MNQHTHGGFEHNFANYRTKPDGSADPTGEAGWFLQRERERRKVSLRQVAQAIRVHPIHLDAIETGDLTRMPHRSDAIGMVGAYAEFLGFDPQPMMMHYAQIIPRQSQPKATGSKKPSALGSARIIEFPLARRLKEMADGGGGVVASVCAAILLFGGLTYAVYPSGDTGANKQIAVSEEKLSGQTKEAGPDTQVSSNAQKIEERLTDTAATEEKIDLAVDPIGAMLQAEADKAADALGGLDKLIANNGQIDGIPADNITTATTKPVQEVQQQASVDAQGRIFGANNKDARLIITATAPVWLRVEDNKGQAIITETLRQGDRFRVPNQEGLVVIARDGGLLTFEIDGKSWGNLGKPGEILVNRSLDLNKLMNKDG